MRDVSTAQAAFGTLDVKAAKSILCNWKGLHLSSREQRHEWNMKIGSGKAKGRETMEGVKAGETTMYFSSACCAGGNGGIVSWRKVHVRRLRTWATVVGDQVELSVFGPPVTFLELILLPGT